MNLDGPPPSWPIFKYQPITTVTLSNLSERKLWASPAAAFNDPFECRLQRTSTPLGIERLRSENPHMAAMSDEALVLLAIDRYEQEFARFGIICFSQQADSILMWSHYGDHHRGMCLGFSHDEKTPLEQAIYPVEYTDEYPELRFDQIWHGEGLARVLHAKHSGWRYECELRQIMFDRTGLQDYPGRLTSVIFGLRTSKADEDLVRKLVGGAVKFQRVSLDPLRYKIVITPA
ncbi:MAG TPA: DUF2971 domain-containing protein [Bryobacteraceae bacterium]|nr:DUF2971 domain-containing protein [Bryobacteraceae bacterium]